MGTYNEFGRYTVEAESNKIPKVYTIRRYVIPKFHKSYVTRY